MASVSDLLKVPALKGIRVAAGEKGLGRRAEHVTVMEVPDIKRWFIRCGKARRNSAP